MNFKERVEKNVTIWFLGMMLTAFLAGIGAYRGIIEISGQAVVNKEKYNSLLKLEGKPGSQENQQKELSTDTEPTSGIQTTSLSPGNTIVLDGLNIGVKLDSDNNYTSKTSAARLTFVYPKNKLATVTEDNKSDDGIVAFATYWIEPDKEIPVTLGQLGSFLIKLTDHKFNEDHDYIQRVTIEAKKN